MRRHKFNHTRAPAAAADDVMMALNETDDITWFCRVEFCAVSHATNDKQMHRLDRRLHTNTYNATCRQQ